MDLKLAVNFGILLALSTIISILLIPICKALAFKLKILDHPDERKIHREPVPYLGGVAIYAGFTLALVVSTFIYRIVETRTAMTVMVASFFIFLLGLIDDIRGSGARLKLVVQITVAIFVVQNGISLELLTNPFGGGSIQLGFWGKIFTVFWIVAISNAMNLLDGLDGLAAGVSAIAILFMTAFSLYAQDYTMSALLIGLMGGIIGFLIFNFPPATIFMGDTGSLLIGFLFSIFCLMPNSKGPYTITILIPAMLLTIPIFDTLLAIIRRAKRRTNIFAADKEHLHHRILVLSKSYRKTLLVIYALNVFIGIIATVAFLLPNEYRIILIAVLAQDILFGLLILRLYEKARGIP